MASNYTKFTSYGIQIRPTRPADENAIFRARPEYVFFSMDYSGGLGFFEIVIAEIFKRDFDQDEAAYDVHACLRECMVEVLGSSDLDKVREIVASKCRIDFGDPEYHWQRVMRLFVSRSGEILDNPSGIGIDVGIGPDI
jgi:hypothetical protein